MITRMPLFSKRRAEAEAFRWCVIRRCVEDIGLHLDYGINVEASINKATGEWTYHVYVGGLGNDSRTRSYNFRVWGGQVKAKLQQKHSALPLDRDGPFNLELTRDFLTETELLIWGTLQPFVNEDIIRDAAAKSRWAVPVYVANRGAVLFLPYFEGYLSRVPIPRSRMVEGEYKGRRSLRIFASDVRAASRR